MEYKQTILQGETAAESFDRILAEAGLKNVLLVCGHSIAYLRWDHYFETLEKRLGIKVHRFSDFEVNPTYEAVIRGLRVFRNTNCEGIIAAGGGSAIDTAKCIKLFSGMDPDRNCLEQVMTENDIPLYAIPTTAGSGSEATQFAVIYQNGEKKSVTDPSCIPSVAVLDPAVLKSLPDKQRIATMLDAICHSVESLWSVNSTQESTRFAKEALTLLWKNADRYLSGDEGVFATVQRAACLAGRAINISRTTAGHAMCYKITTRYGIPHGAAAALCVSKLWKQMLHASAECIDPRGRDHLAERLELIAACMGYQSTKEAQSAFEDQVDRLVTDRPRNLTDPEIELLAETVNAERLGNHPIRLKHSEIIGLYREIFINEAEESSER